MVLRLIGEEQIEDVEFGGTTFRVHVRSGTWWARLQAKHSDGGKFDEGAYLDEFARGCLKGWDTLHDADGSAIEYSEDVAVRVYHALPEEAQDAIYRVAKARHLKYREALGN